MSLSIGLDQKELIRLSNKLVRLNDNQIATATRQAINKSLKKMRSLAVKRIALNRKLKKKDIRKRMVEIPVRGGTQLHQMRAMLKISGKTIGLINFVRGSKDVPNKKGIAVRKRKVPRVEVVPGRAKKRKDLFIIKGNNGRNVLVKRQGKSAHPLGGREATTGLAEIVRRREVQVAITKLTGVRLVKEFSVAVNFQLSKLR